MINKNIFEAVGTIIKKEILSSIEHDTSKALVLETLKPYPGYHGTTIPDQLNPISLFFVTDKKYSGEKVIRATMAVKKEFSEPFDATPGQITVFNALTPCIRIKDLNTYERISELVDLYRKHGIDFIKDRKVDEFYGLIKIRKYFELENIEDGLYKDLKMPQMAYFFVPNQISWDVFESITHNLKVNPEYNNFDAALGIFFPPDLVIDAVRIYNVEIDMEHVKMLRDKYLQEIKRI
ncbi:MAG: hypothetical protein K9H16_07120 [Bacteroidales bacterium]|nr:hypothetical protein [Bacteroidales bacterium]